MKPGMSPGKEIGGGGGGEDERVVGIEGEADDVDSGNDEARLSFRGDADDAAVSAPGGGHVEVALEVEGESLGTSEMSEERSDDAVRIDLIDAVVGGGGGTGDVEISVGRKGQVIGGDAGLEGGKDEDLAVGRDFEDGAAAVADVEIAEPRRRPCRWRRPCLRRRWTGRPRWRGDRRRRRGARRCRGFRRRPGRGRWDS